MKVVSIDETEDFAIGHISISVMESDPEALDEMMDARFKRVTLITVTETYYNNEEDEELIKRWEEEEGTEDTVLSHITPLLKEKLGLKGSAVEGYQLIPHEMMREYLDDVKSEVEGLSMLGVKDGHFRNDFFSPSEYSRTSKLMTNAEGGETNEGSS